MDGTRDAGRGVAATRGIVARDEGRNARVIRTRGSGDATGEDAREGWVGVDGRCSSARGD